MNRQIPPERPLPDRQQILDRILAEARGEDAAEQEKRRRRWLIPVVALASVAVIVAAALVVPKTIKSGDPAVIPTTKPAEPEISLDLGPLSPWLEAKIAAPGALSGLEMEYKVISLYSRDSGTLPGGLMLGIADRHNQHSLSRSPEGVAGFRTSFEDRDHSASFEVLVHPPSSTYPSPSEPSPPSAASPPTAPSTFSSVP